MFEKKMMVNLAFLLVGLVLFSSFVIAAGSSFDSATVVKNGDVITETLRAGENHYYTYFANDGDDVEMIVEHETVMEDLVGDSWNKYSEDNIILQGWNFEKQSSFREDSAFYHLKGIYDLPIVFKYNSENDGNRWLSIFIDQKVAPSIDYTLKVSIKCKEGYAGKFKKCISGKWVYDQVTDEESGQTISADACLGCIWNSKCYKNGKNFTGLDNIKRYCDEATKEVKEQKKAGGSCVQSYECAFPLTCAEGKCYDLRQVEDKNTSKTIYAKDCVGCLVGEICYTAGNRFKDENETASFCSVQKKVVAQYTEEKLCNENYECDSNVCAAGKCISASFIEKILNWFKNLFG